MHEKYYNYDLELYNYEYMRRKEKHVNKRLLRKKLIFMYNRIIYVCIKRTLI